MKKKILFLFCLVFLFWGCMYIENPEGGEDPDDSQSNEQPSEDQNVPEKELIGFSITSLPCSFYNIFYENVFSEEGLVVTKMYSDGTQEVCERSEFYMVINNTEIKAGDILDSNLLGQQEITIYLYNHPDLWAKFWIDIICQENEVPPEDVPPEDNPSVDDTIINFYVHTLPDKVQYVKGDELSLTGLVCYAMDISFQTFTVEPTKFTIVYNPEVSWQEEELPDSLPVGTHKICVYYNDFCSYFEITVFDLKEIFDFAYENTGDSITIGGYEGTDFIDREEGYDDSIPDFDPDAPYEKIYSKPEDFEYIFIEGSTTEIDVIGIKDEVEDVITEVIIPATIDGYTVKTVATSIVYDADEARTFIMEEGIQGFSERVETRDFSYPNFYFRNGKKITKMYLPSSLIISKENLVNYFYLGFASLRELSIDFTNFDSSFYSTRFQEEFLFASNLKKITIRLNPNSPAVGFENGEKFFNKTSIEEIEFVFNDEEFIPGEYQNQPEIYFTWDEGSFENIKTLKKVTYPENCGLYIGEGAFANSSIESFTFTKNSKVVLLTEAFKDCNNLANIIFDYGCELYNAHIPSEYIEGNGYWEIKQSHFEGSLWSKTVTKLDLSIFDECWLDFSNFTALEEVIIGSCVVHSDFSGCKNLSKITMNDDADFLPWSLSETALTSVTIQGNEPRVDYLYDNEYSVLNGEHPGLFTNCENLIDITFKNCKIPPYIFGLNGTERTGISLNCQNVALDMYAFYKCAFLKEFDMTEVESYTFSGKIGHHFAFCENLEKVVYTHSSFSGGMFYNCTNLVTVELKKVINDFPADCFYNCYNLENMMLPETTEKLTYAENSFYAASKIAKKFVENNLVTEQFPFAFKKVQYGLNNLTIGNLSVFDFSEVSVKNLTLSDDYYYIPENFALGNDYLETVTLDGDIKSAAFKDCSSLKTVIIGDRTFHVVCENSFEGCISLEKIIVPSEFYEQYINAECWIPYKDLIVPAE